MRCPHETCACTQSDIRPTRFLGTKYYVTYGGKKYLVGTEDIIGRASSKCIVYSLKFDP